MNNLVIKYYVQGRLHLEELIKQQKGVTAIEYALIGVAMATLLAVVLGDQNSGFLGTLKKTFETITASIQSVTSPLPTK